jgi:pimeloyl-ACP methyl ester carboxylesterase
MHGDADPVVAPSHAEFYAAAIPGARLELLPGIGHAVPLTARAEFAAAVRSLR